LKGTLIGTSTDETGHYYLKNLPVGQYTIVASYMGYISKEITVDVVANQTQEVNFEIEEDLIQLETVVVSANKNETNRRETPVVVNVLTPALFENTNSVCLAQGLNFQPGLRVENNCQNCGFQQVRINGLEGPYTQILLDSKPLFSSLAGVYGIEQIPVSMIERVEVIRGGGSALYGSNAIAGTINIITKAPTNNLFNVSHNISAIQGETFDNTTSMNASLVNEKRNAGIYLFGTARNRQHYDENDDSFSEIGKINSSTLGFRSFLKTSDYTRFNLEYHNIREFRRGGNKFNLQPHETDITEQTEHTINGGGLDFMWFSKDYKQKMDIYSSIQQIDRQSYYGSGEDPNAYGRSHDFTFLSGLQYSYSMNKFLFMPATLTTGIEYSHNKLTDAMPGYNREINQKVNVYSFYLQNEWKVEKMSILLGGRIDKNSLISDPIFSPRINFRYNPIRNLSLRASYSEGFRAPQTYDEDLHITAVGGEVAIIQSDPNLKTEKSHSYSLSADYTHNFGNVMTNFMVEAYYTYLKNVFVLEDIGMDAEGNKTLERRNGSGATVQGINFEGKIVPSRKIQLQFGYSLQDSRYKEAQKWSEDDEVPPTKHLLRSPDQYGYFTGSYQIIKPLTIALSGTYTGPMYVSHFAGYIEQDELKKTEDFFDMTVRLTYNFKLIGNYNIEINAGVQNIFNAYQNDFDKGKDRDSGYIYGPGVPRTYFAGIKFGIN
ncbi:TonB-dependent receptor, partial [Odoribacter sp. OttesenSCG-928-J03]|nr:TonB-dependent receptor [Odoribacter sp. OttesenSCG-928-J03]